MSILEDDFAALMDTKRAGELVFFAIHKDNIGLKSLQNVKIGCVECR